jgi:hypothetical protein
MSFNESVTIIDYHKRVCMTTNLTNTVIFVMEKCYFLEVQTELLHIIWMIFSFNRSTILLSFYIRLKLCGQCNISCRPVVFSVLKIELCRTILLTELK